ncbi:MAG: protein kinase [Deltaproteobacteria bacterium]|nr:protein kinase [Deltaproteobacteria bacterium]
MSGANPELEARATKGTLLLAARRAAAVSPTAGTVRDVLEHHALGHYAEGLRQYLTIRLGSVERGLDALTRLREQVGEGGVDQLLEPPGIKARLFRLAREISQAPRPSNVTLEWYSPKSARSGGYLSGLAQLRKAPHDEDRELLELRHARELSVEEIAFVLGEPAEAIEKRIDAAESSARSLFQRAGDGVDLPRALLEAFALDKLEDEIASAHAPPQHPDEQPFVPTGTIIDEHYELEKYIGSGGFADVYRARDLTVPGHHVALKVLKRQSVGDQAKEAALRELRLIAAVFHPSIVQFKDHGWYESRLWFAMPWYEGETLETRLEREPLTREEAQAIFVPLARALSAMHASGVRHQDVKPDNIFLANLEGFGDQQQLLPVLLDLGVAATDAELVIAGTPTYFAPEVAAQFAHQEGEPVPEYPIGPAADVFALALSLRNALEPHTAPEITGGAIDTFIASRARDMPEPPVTKELRYLRPHFERWLALDPAERPTAAELADELEDILTRPERVRARRMRNLRIFGPLAVALLAVFGTVTYELYSQAQESGEKAAALEAERTSALDDLESETERREALEGEIADARGRIESSNLNREQLAEQLAEAEGSLQVTRRRLTLARRQVQELDKRAESLTADLAAARTAKTAAERRVAELETSAEATERQLTDARRQLSEANARVGAVQQELDTARAAATAAGEQLRQAQGRIAQLTSERDEAQSALAAARRRIEQLERQARQPSAPTQANPDIEAPTAPTTTVPPRTGSRRPAVPR